jgi:hypothetical protein
MMLTFMFQWKFAIIIVLSQCLRNPQIKQRTDQCHKPCQQIQNQMTEDATRLTMMKRLICEVGPKQVKMWSKSSEMPWTPRQPARSCPQREGKSKWRLKSDISLSVFCSFEPQPILQWYNFFVVLLICFSPSWSSLCIVSMIPFWITRHTIRQMIEIPISDWWGPSDSK